MKRILPLCLFLLFLASGCKKIIQQQEQNAILDLVTNGKWKVTRFLQNANDSTAAFSVYLFQFYRNGTVEGISMSQVIQGTWAADVNARTITANFPSAGSPVNLLNAVWKITDSYTDSVSAKTISAPVNKLELKKQ